MMTEPKAEMSSLTAAGSPDRFGYEWNHYSEILPESRVQLQRWLGPVTLESFAGLDCMDVGCGMGRNPFWMTQAGAKSMTAVDVDPRSLEAARGNLSKFPHARVHTCSAYDLDPKDLGSFDRVTNIGVLHHLADPVLALKKMWSCVRPGGELVVWVYGKTGNRLILPFIKIAQFLGSRLPLPLVHVIAHVLAVVVWVGIRVMPMKVEYFRFIRKISFGNLVSIVFDQMIPKIANYWDEPDLNALIANLNGVKSKRIELVQGNSWTMVLRKDSANA